ncbi:hypothetical protein LOAG_09780 [Loa loa]|uniref:Uncharacterized protein n=1 Tax=Loa loa TaxID=7209 RepID=A0A1S0TR19_LOALO|nr:hypothetical protein LOAG_09780 [Loa loa]EFO18712.1 hypothetical protein LOAG_09780 [Loa loa]
MHDENFRFVNIEKGMEGSYDSLVVSTFISTTTVIMLLSGMRKKPYFMLPFIVYCSLQAVISDFYSLNFNFSLLFLSYFITTALLQYWFSGTFSLFTIQLIAIFISASLYWVISLRIVREQRQQIQKSAKSHHKLLV